MKFAVIKSGGKQYRVSEGDVVELERLTAQDNKVLFDNVLLYSDGAEVKIGQPFVEGISVTGVLVEDFKGEKIRVAKFKAKARYRRTTGHRQSLSRVKIEAIGVKTEAPKAKKTTTKARTSAQKA